MPLLESGVYVESTDKAYEVESCYYLGFQIKSALYSINCIYNYKYTKIKEFDSNAQYLHYFTDHLLYSVGQISNRFITNTKNRNKRIEMNCLNFRFDSNNYPILSNKKYRNTIEHIDEYNEYTIKNYDGVGGFNFLDYCENKKMITTVMENRKQHIYTLDLINKKIYIQRKEEELVLDIDKLENELSKLKNSVDYFYKIFSSPF